MIAIYGYSRIGKDKLAEYENLVSKEIQCVSAEDYDNSEIYYEKAVSILPDRIDAYYQKAVALSDQRRYGDCIDFINSKILSNATILKNTEEMDSVYSLLGDAYEEMEDYENAGICYDKAIVLITTEQQLITGIMPLYWRERAIRMRLKKSLKKARENGMDSVAVNYVEGEILFCLRQI